MLKPFAPGNPGGGRPRGAKNRLHRAFVQALHADFEEHGPAAIRICRMEDPTNYLRVIASILPRELTIETAAADLTDDELDAMIQRLRMEMLEALPPEPLLIEARPNVERQRHVAHESEQTQGRTRDAESRAQSADHREA
jgi:hypothetical protein